MPKSKPRKAIITEDSITIPNNLGVAPYDTILVLQHDGQTKTEGGLYLPDMSVEKPPVGVVITFGQRTDNLPSEVEVGDHIQWDEGSGIPINIKGTEYLLLTHKSLLWNYKKAV